MRDKFGITSTFPISLIASTPKAHDNAADSEHRDPNVKIRNLQWSSGLPAGCEEIYVIDDVLTKGHRRAYADLIQQGVPNISVSTSPGLFAPGTSGMIHTFSVTKGDNKSPTMIIHHEYGDERNSIGSLSFSTHDNSSEALAPRLGIGSPPVSRTTAFTLEEAYGRYKDRWRIPVFAICVRFFTKLPENAYSIGT